ncbi:HPr family phosphocarrier protein [Halalkalibacter flavus]|uniref:HPr family phosphocarrier protein n=1 Tax=Halalkalibacter flavus TaxID=3090668 RepID=UPI002FC70EFB
MIKEEVVINNNLGIHLRPASELINSVKQGNSTVSFIHNGQTSQVVSLLSILKLGIEKGSPITLIVDGPDEEMVFAKIKTCIGACSHLK